MTRKATQARQAVHYENKPRRGRRRPKSQEIPEIPYEEEAEPGRDCRGVLPRRRFVVLAVVTAVLGLVGRLQDGTRVLQLTESNTLRRQAPSSADAEKATTGANEVVDPQQTSQAKTDPPSPPSTPPQNTDPPFPGSKITQISPGMDLFENICVQRGEGRIPNRLLSFTADGEDLHSSSYKYMRVPNWGQWTANTNGRKLKDWSDMIRNDNVALVTDETLLTLNLWNNPGHCLNDLVFSLALDTYKRNLKSDSGPVYPSYLYSYFRGLRTDKYEPDWCFEFMQKAGYIEPDKLVVRSEQTICFERLLVPILVLYRFPVDWNKEDGQSLSNHPWGQEIPRKLNREYANYPQEALQMLKDSVMKGSGLSNTPWQHERPQDMEQTNTTILLYGREGIHTRALQNYQDIALQLEKDYYASVDVVDHGKWDEFLTNATAQMDLFNRYGNIVIVHGAHQANQMFCRPQTRIVEIVPGDINPMPSLTAKFKNETKTSLEWYGQSGWFASFSRRVSQEHFVIGEPGHSLGSKEFTVDVTRMVEFIASRFGLTKREKEVLAAEREYAIMDFEIADDMVVPG